jgi:hypothetical protein
MAMSPGFCRKQKGTQLTQACAKRKRNINGGSWNDEGIEGGNRLYAGSFWHQVRKKPELWADNSKGNLKNFWCAQVRGCNLILIKKNKTLCLISVR